MWSALSVSHPESMLLNGSCFLIGFPWWLRLPAVREIWVLSLGLGRSPGQGNGNPFQYSWLENFPWTEEPGRLQFMGSQRVGHDWVTNTFTFIWCWIKLDINDDENHVYNIAVFIGTTPDLRKAYITILLNKFMGCNHKYFNVDPSVHSHLPCGVSSSSTG